MSCPPDATRVNASFALTTKVWQRLSLRFARGMRQLSQQRAEAAMKYLIALAALSALAPARIRRGGLLLILIGATGFP